MRSLIAIVILHFLGGCTISKKIQHDVVDFNRAVEATSNEVAFLNILRSYKRMPRHYTAISTLQGNLKVTAGADLSSTVNPGTIKTEIIEGDTTLATARDTYTPKLSGSVTTNPSYSVGVLESQEFYNGLMKPIDVNTIALYVSQGWDSELIMNLFIEGVWLKSGKEPRQKSEYIPNDVANKRWRKLAECADLTTESKTTDAPFIIDNISFTDEGVAKLYKAGLSIKACNGKQGSCGSKTPFHIAGKASTSPVLNIDLDKSACIGIDDISHSVKENINSEEQIKFFKTDVDTDSQVSQKKVRYTNSGTKGQQIFTLKEFNDETVNQESMESTIMKKDDDTKMSLVTRSTDSIIFYIGEYLRKIQSPVKNCTGEVPGLGHVDEIMINETDPMFRICELLKTDGIIEANIVGENWMIPKDTRKVTTRSMQVIALIQQLINLNKVSKDLPKPTFIQVN